MCRWIGRIRKITDPYACLSKSPKVQNFHGIFPVGPGDGTTSRRSVAGRRDGGSIRRNIKIKVARDNGSTAMCSNTLTRPRRILLVVKIEDVTLAIF